MFAFDKPLTWIIILVIVLLIFGAGKLPDIGRSLGRSIKEFKDETTNGLEGDKGDKAVTPSTTTSTIATPVASGSINASSSVPAPTIRRRIIKHPDGSEEIIEEPIS